MSTVLDAIQNRGVTDRFQQMTKRAVSTRPDVHWRYDVSSSKHFPFSYYATALRGSGPDAEEILTISIECIDVQDDKGEHLLVSADITGKDGVLLAESPKTTIDVPSEASVLSNPDGVIGSVTKKIEAAIEDAARWIDEQHEAIERLLVVA